MHSEQRLYSMFTCSEKSISHCWKCCMTMLSVSEAVYNGFACMQLLLINVMFTTTKIKKIHLSLLRCFSEFLFGDDSKLVLCATSKKYGCQCMVITIYYPQSCDVGFKSWLPSVNKIIFGSDLEVK